MYRLTTASETYSVTEEGLIGRPSLGMKPSGKWKLLGAERQNNFGATVEFIPFPQCLEITNWRHDNGKARWHIRDLDYGTTRVWGSNPVIYFGP